MTRVMQILFFAATGTTVNVLLHYYLWTRLVRDPRWPAPWDRVGTGVVVALALLAPLTMFAGRVVWPALGQALAWPGFVWMGTMFLLFCALVAMDALRALGLAGLKLAGRPDLLVDPERRQALAAGMAVAGAAVAGTLSTVAVRRMGEGAEVKTVEVDLPRLPRALDGLVVAQLTDIHVGSTLGKDYVQYLVDRTNGMVPDVVAITGDLVDGSPEELGDAVNELARLRARLGIYFVTGNHEYYSGVDEWLAYLRGLGIRVLRNERVTLEQDGAALDLAGIDDFNADRFGNGHGADLPRALLGRDPARELLLLAHQPRAVREAESHGVGLMLSGHTHGGQIWPWNYAVRLQQPYVEGLYQHGRSQLYVSPGTGYWGPPMRLGTRAEITRLVLKAPQT